ncbi:MAG TPA: hypothetical protein VKM55_28730 [Candidatus Lokiarchaeia archaeon]|nr:hypothetical protein [Candidatus Lokiarchaeia archaeon]
MQIEGISVDFFEQKNGNRDSNGDSSAINLEKFCVIYLAYFDEARGHQLLLVHPPELKDDAEFLQAESKIVFVHSIWWMSVDVQAELSHVDLEFEGRNYLAKKFLAPSNRPKRRSGMEESTPETVVLILNIPINLNPFGGELLNLLYQEITANHLDDFSIAIEKSICDAKIIMNPKDKETSEAGTKVLEGMTITMHRVLQEFSNQLEITGDNKTDKTKALAYLLYQDIKKKPPSADDTRTFFEASSGEPIIDVGAAARSRIKIEDAVLKKNENKVYVTLLNTSTEEICNCVVSIAYIEDFFEKYFYDVNVDCWFGNEELNFQFERIGKKLKEEYLVTVKQDATVLFQKKILTQKLKVE